MRILAAFGILLSCLFLLSCSGTSLRASVAASGNLLSGRAPSAAYGVNLASRLTDGIVAKEGDFWRTNLSTVFASAKAYAIYDLGEPSPIAAVYVQGDNDDEYLVSGSDDGQTFRPVFRASRVQGAGMRPRMSGDLHEQARYLRVSASGGDGAYALTEVQVFSSRPSVFPPQLPASIGTPVFDYHEEGELHRGALHLEILVFALALSGIVLLGYRKAPRWAQLGILLPLLPSAWLASEIWSLVPPSIPLLEQSLLRGSIAAVALITILREVLGTDREGPGVRIRLATLGVLSAFAIACYYNLFVPQFPDHARDDRTFVHWFDMRVYFPVAKYFDELRFDGLYFASVAAYLEDEPKAADAMAKENVRDLRDHRMRKVGEVKDEIQGIKQRFSAERWESFKRDMRYFRLGMGRASYVWSLQDHGGNATPVWLLAAKLIFAHLPACDATLIAAGLIDPLLLALLFFAVWRTFGLRTMLITVITFGATDFYMFNSDFAGSTMRQDWLVAVGLGACALKKERWVLGGGLLAYGGLIRAFPGMAVVFLAAPTVVFLTEHYLRNKCLPSWAVFRERTRPLGRAWLGAMATVAALVLISALVFPSGTWPAWLHKVHLLSKDAHLNHVGWRTLIMFDTSTTFEALHKGQKGDWQELQFANFAARAPLYYLGIVVFGIFALLATRNKSLDRAALTGLFFIPIVFYPANYYCHFVFLLAMWASYTYEQKERKGMGAAWGWACLLGICIAQYFTLEYGTTDLCFVEQSAILLVGFVLILWSDAIEGYRALFPKTALAGAVGAVAAASAAGATDAAGSATDRARGASAARGTDAGGHAAISNHRDQA